MPRTRKNFDYDLLIIGSGAGGGVAAHIASGKGKKVAIVEGDTLGGECPNYGCVPTKALLHSAQIFDEARRGKPYGIMANDLKVNYRKVRDWKDLAVLRTGTSDGEKAFKADGIDVIKGFAHFINKHEVSVGRRRFTAKNFIIATGTSDNVPPIEGLKEVGYIGYREAIDLKMPPRSLFVIGGGAIGSEFAQLFASFGTRVHVAEFAPRLLAREDAEMGELVQAVFEQKYGIKVHVATKVVKVTKEDGKKVVHYETMGKKGRAKVDEILLATGKHPNTDLGLDNAGVEFDKRGIKTDETMQTTASHIYAAGDVVGPYAFTHMASYQSRIAAHNLFEKTVVKANYHAVTRCVFVNPEAAAVGMTEEEATRKGIKTKIGAVPISVVGRANATDQKIGYVKVIATPQGVIIGASIVAPRAGEMIHELALAVQLGLKAEDISATIHAFPTWSEAVRVACAKLEWDK